MARKKTTILTGIKEWYAKNHPTDPMKDDINPEATFHDLMNALMTGQDIYDTIGASDSLIRERLLHGLSKVSRVDIDTLYDIWLDGRDALRKNKEKNKAA